MSMSVIGSSNSIEVGGQDHSYGREGGGGQLEVSRMRNAAYQAAWLKSEVITVRCRDREADGR